MNEEAQDLEVGMTVSCAYGGKRFKIGKIEKGNDGRYSIYNTRGKRMHISGKAVPFIVYY
jgi:hypothetical protein